MTTATLKTTTTPPAVGQPRVLSADDVEVAAELLGRGFETDPGSVAFVTDPRQRLLVNQLSSARALTAALPYAAVYGIDIGGDLAGVAIWHPPGVSATSWHATLQHAAQLARHLPTIGALAPPLLATLFRDRQTATRFPAQHRAAVRAASVGPAWHLAILATAAAHRGRGVARALIDHVLVRCDADGLPAWLETTNPANPPIYQRFGFQTVAEIEGGSTLPTWWIMRREPR